MGASFFIHQLFLDLKKKKLSVDICLAVLCFTAE